MVIILLAFVIHVMLALTIHIHVLPFVFFPFRPAKWSTFIWIPIIGMFTTLLLLQVPTKKSNSHIRKADNVETKW